VNRRRKAKVVTGAMLELAIGFGALETNPVRGTASVVRPKTDPRPPLTVDEIETVRAAVRTWMTADRPGPKASTDMADSIDLMLATGAHIGEVLAIRWSDIDLETEPPALTLSGTIKTEPGKGTYRKPLPGGRTVSLPKFAAAVLRRRLHETPRNAADAVFPTRNGTWQQVNNVERRWRQIRRDTGLEWVTPRAFRTAGFGDIERG
jgi:integrase